MEHGNIGILFILGTGVFGGMMGAWIFQRLRIPQVVGYICIGLLIGQSGLQIVRLEDIQALEPFNLFALGIIGFLVGGEIQTATLKKYARQFTAILLGEGVTAFLLVGLASFGIILTVAHDWHTALAGAVVLGAIASATDPASTIDVLWEYRARGVLTTAIIAIVAMDDALAMILYGLGTSVAQLLASGHVSLEHEALKIGIELVGAVLLGIGVALLLNLFLRWLHKPERSLPLALGLILLTISAATMTGMDVILATMSLGFVLTNIAPRRSRELFETLRSFSVPIYVLFFVLVGARLSLSYMPLWLWGIVVAYVLCRSAGKIAGAWAGARLTHSEPVVQRHLGTALFAQGGVAVGLSIMASQHMQGIQMTSSMSLGDMVIFAVTATTLIVQIAGPPLVKLTIKASGETGRNVTEDDVIESLKTEDVMSQPVTVVREADPLRRVIDLFSESDQLIYPVVNGDGRVVGTISPEELKDVLADQEAWEWLLAADVMVETHDEAVRNAPLQETLQRMKDLGLEQLPVVESEADSRPVGMLTMIQVRKRIAELTIKRQQSPAP